MAEYEVCEVKAIKVKEGRFLGKSTYCFVAVVVNSKTELYRSEEFKWEPGDYSPELEPVLKAILNGLLSSGWNQIGETPKTTGIIYTGKVVTFRKALKDDSIADNLEDSDYLPFND